jgi:Cu/Ag efflux pump CusA
VRRAAGTLVAGEEVGDMFQHGVSTNVMVWSAPKTRDSLTAIRNLPIDTPTHGQVPLATLADVAIHPTPNVIQRENASRRIDVGADLPKGRDLGAVTHDIQNRLDHMKLPLGYHAELLGEAAERHKAQHRLLTLAIIAALVIFMLLQAAFGSWRLASLMFFTLPMALVGGILAAYAGVGEISLGALIGFYTVMGIAARNGIMMVTHFQHLERHEGEPFGPALVLRGARERLAPILMTASATALALVPLAVAGSIPGHEIEHPMAIVILGGLVTSTMLNLFVVPFLYLRFGAGAGESRKRAELPPIDVPSGDSWPPPPPELVGSGTSGPGMESPW